VRVEVRNNNIDGALRALKKKLQQERIFNDIRRKEYHETKGQKRRRKAAAGRQRWLKEDKKRKDELGL
tara:strand:- start:53 stop:256 length:204 start_codon:yes stop_codon:yes gene_type:complete